MLTNDEKGNILLELIEGPEAELCANSTLSPLTHALVLARKNDRILFVFNRFHQKWELPGGVIDPGESPGECALRELMEESNQTLQDIEFKGLMKLELMNKPESEESSRLEFGALYMGSIEKDRQFKDNHEVEAIAWWDGKEAIGPISGIDAWLAINIGRLA